MNTHQALSIGIDLDNTLICYDHAFAVAARERRLVPAGFTGGKQQLRDHIRASAGEEAWQKLQGYVYGAGIHEASLFEGAVAFLERARQEGAILAIVSHKTEKGHFDAAQVNLREAAMGFLKERGIFDYIPESQIFFTATRAEKITKITALSPHVFIDDLVEVFLEPGFPQGVRRFLLSAAPPDSIHGFEHCRDWRQVELKVFDATGNTGARE